MASLAAGIGGLALAMGTLFTYLGVLIAVPAILTGIIAALMGHLGLSRAARTGAGHRLAIAGFVLGYVAIGIALTTAPFWFGAFLFSGSGFA
jgi:hypothetical protein